MRQLYRFTDQEIDILGQYWQQSKSAARAGDMRPGETLATATRRIFGDTINSKRINNVPGTATIAGTTSAGTGHMFRGIDKKIEAMTTGLEKSNDGQFIVTTQLLYDIKSHYESEIDKLKNAGRLSEDVMEQIIALQKDVDGIGRVLAKVQGNDDVITRINLGAGQFMGEAMVMGSKKAEKIFGLKDGLIPYVIADSSAVKTEVGTDAVRNLLMNIGSGGDQVFTDPLMFLSHSEYFMQPNMIRILRQNALEGIGKTNEFMGAATRDAAIEAIPKAVIEQIRTEALSIPGGMEDIDRIPFRHQYSHLKRINEAQDIQRLLASGVDPRKIPQLVRRITDYYNAQVVRLKDGRAEVIMPTANRYNLRTFDVRLDKALGFEDFQKEVARIPVDLARYGSPSGFVQQPGYGKLTGLTTPVSNPSEIPLLGFRIKGKAMMLAGEAAYLYQHSLGGFDLDDKGVPLMSTFTDSSGKKRLAFMTLRQPTAFQESIAMSADLRHHGTLKAALGKDKKFLSILNDPQALREIGISSDSPIINGIKRAIGSRKQDELILPNTPLKDIEAVIIKIKEKAYGSLLPELTPRQMVKMAMIQSPSMLGLDAITSSGKPFAQMATELGIDPNSVAPGYQSDLVYQVLKAEGENERTAQLISSLERKLGFEISGSTDEEKMEVVSQLVLGKNAPGYFRGIEHIIAAESEKFLELIQKQAANVGIEDTIGVFINRQSMATYTVDAAASIIGGGDRALYEAFQKSSAFLTVSASNAVDIAKSVGLQLKVDHFSRAAQAIRIEQGISDEVAEKVWQAYVDSMSEEERIALAGGQGASLRLSPVGENMLRSQAGISFARGKQVLDQVLSTGSIDEDQLFGLERSLFERATGYARVGNEQEIEKIRVHILRGFNEFLEYVEANKQRLNLSNQAENQVKEYLRQQIEILESGEKGLVIRDGKITGGALYSFFMRQGTEAYEKYAKHDQVVQMMKEIQATADLTKSSSLRKARQEALNMTATADPEYTGKVKAVIDKYDKNIKEISKIEKMLNNTSDVQIYQLRKLRIELNTKIGEAILGIQQSQAATATGKSVLDIVDTFDALLEQKDVTVAAILKSEMITEDNPDVAMVIKLFNQSRIRRLAVLQRRSTDLDAMSRMSNAFDIVEDLRQRITGSRLTSVTDITEMSADQAKEYISELRSLTGKGKGEDAVIINQLRSSGLIPDLTDQQEEAINLVKELAGRTRKNSATDFLDGSPEVINAYNFYTSSRSVQQAEQQALDLFQSSNVQIDNSMRTILSNVVNSSPVSVVRTSYKRFKDSFKTGALGDAFRDKGVKTAVVAAAALAAFGFIYSAKKERGQQEMTGPPMLPGGSAYETDYPKMEMSSNPYSYSNQSSVGMQYKVYLNGSTDQAENLSSMLGGVVDGPINSTMYNSLPNLGQDRYAEVASRF